MIATTDNLFTFIKIEYLHFACYNPKSKHTPGNLFTYNAINIKNQPVPAKIPEIFYYRHNNISRPVFFANSKHYIKVNTTG